MICPGGWFPAARTKEGVVVVVGREGLCPLMLEGNGDGDVCEEGKGCVCGWANEDRALALPFETSVIPTGLVVSTRVLTARAWGKVGS